MSRSIFFILNAFRFFFHFSHYLLLCLQSLTQFYFLFFSPFARFSFCIWSFIFASYLNNMSIYLLYILLREWICAPLWHLNGHAKWRHEMENIFFVHISILLCMKKKIVLSAHVHLIFVGICIRIKMKIGGKGKEKNPNSKEKWCANISRNENFILIYTNNKMICALVLKITYV